MDTTASLSPASELSSAELAERRERVFLILAAVFICSMTLLNVIGITRFVQLGPMALTVGVLPYPLTFLCTDLICELYGKRRANFLVTIGLCLNLLILGILWLGQALPSVPPGSLPPWQVLSLAEPVGLPNGSQLTGNVELFDFFYLLATGGVFASMMAYVTAQYCDVKLFHFWRRVTKGKHLWLRNNLSTLVSQGVDSVMVVTVTFGAVLLAGGISLEIFLGFIASNYLFKMCCALADTGPFYYFTYKLRRYLQLSDDYEASAAPGGR
ncbi:queuosine precursor transporter [Pseudomaricurvus sp. HS19]|uniref:queuosine precursor transporter n=1 Tax=Pseudomaricurvus sp. HS19 TaxID=2692626 RepID=UPI001369FF87|nr:queuosine precursor transporter [Pseudomaricurvus sp. HS19]MYM61941.1 queuosine precursor transporter [Pseudomaricurvus sp. HS19]